jgi:paraquat-inducible protein A
MIALAFLALSVQLNWQKQVASRTRLYRLVELVGRWSMLDIYVIAILVALVQLKGLATIKAGPAAFAFAGVIVLTVVAARSFDPRLMWDRLKKESEHGRTSR